MPSRRLPDAVLWLPCARLPPGCLLRRHRGRTKQGVEYGFVEYGDGSFGWDTIPGQRLAMCSVTVVVPAYGTPTWVVVGGFAYDIKTRAGIRTLKARGTWVHPAYRRDGLGTILWDTAIAWERPGAVAVHVVTDKGRTLSEALRRRHPLLDWSITEGGRRKLRSLKAA